MGLLTSAARDLSASSSSSSGGNRICWTFSPKPPNAGSTMWTSPVGPPAEYTWVYGGGIDM